MERCTTREKFCQVIRGLAERFGDELCTAVVEAGSASADAWVRTHGGAWLREALGVALTSHSPRVSESSCDRGLHRSWCVPCCWRCDRHADAVARGADLPRHGCDGSAAIDRRSLRADA